MIYSKGKKFANNLFFTRKKVWTKNYFKIQSNKNTKTTKARKEIFKLTEMINSSKSIKNSTIVALKYLNEFKNELNLYPLTNRYKNLLIDTIEQIKEGI